MEEFNIKSGVIMIPDISGFTEFVFKTKFYTGEFIVRQLLSVLLDENQSYFDVSEIEGDSILFFRYEDKPSYEEISTLILRMKQSFDLKVKELSFLLDTPIDLALKFVVHYGKFSQYKIKNFRKLYGKTVIEAHQMLKNKSISQICYIYYSHAFLDFKSVDNLKKCQKITKTAFGEYHLL